MELVDHTSAQPWQVYPYLKYGYRPQLNFWHSLLSIFQFHNETGNIWTMIASLYFGTLFFMESPKTLPFIALYLGQILHHPVSIGYHTFMSISKEIKEKLKLADMIMVLVMNLCTTFAFGYHVIGYGKTILLIFMICLGIYKHLSLKIQDRKSLVKIIAVSAAGYYIILFYDGLANRIWIPFFWSLCCHGISAWLYVNHFPQSKFPGQFDYHFHSHVLMHIVLFVCYNSGYFYIMHSSSTGLKIASQDRSI